MTEQVLGYDLRGKLDDPRLADAVARCEEQSRDRIQQKGCKEVRREVKETSDESGPITSVNIWYA